MVLPISFGPRTKTGAAHARHVAHCIAISERDRDPKAHVVQGERVFARAERRFDGLLCSCRANKRRGLLFPTALMGCSVAATMTNAAAQFFQPPRS